MALDKDNIEKYGIQAYGTGRRGDTTLLWTSYQSSFKKSEDQAKAREVARSVTDLINNTHAGFTQNGNMSVPSGKPFSQSIWRNMNANSYFNTNPQKVLDGLLNLKAGDNILMFDMETLGTFNGTKKDSLPWYTPTEIGLVHSVFNEDGTVSVQKGLGSSKSLLVKPDAATYQKIQGLLGELKTSQGRGWRNFSDDQRRSLSDLILYAGTKEELFDERGGVTYVKNQMRHLMPLPGSVLSDPTMIRRMELGLANLWDYGNDVSTVAMEMNAMIMSIKQKTKKDIKIGGYNIHAFDIPLFQDYINNSIAQSKDSKITKALQTLKANVENTDHIDVYAGINTLYTDSLERFGMNKKLEHLVSKFKLGEAGISHMATYDATQTAHLLSHLMTKEGMLGHIDNIKNNSLSGWDRQSIESGDRFFAHSGALGGKYDQVLRLVTDEKDPNVGKLMPAYTLSGDTNVVSLYKNAEYSVHGMYEELNFEGVNHYGLLLKNEDDGLFHFIARDRFEDIQNVIHKNLSFLGDKTTLGGADRTAWNFSNKDRALRHYSRMFSEEGGISLIERTYRGLDAYKEGFAKYRQREIDLDQLEGMVRKAGGWDNSGTWVDGTSEFFRNIKILAGRLEEERDTTMTMVERIKSDALLGQPNAGGYYDREAQGLALRNFRRYMDHEFGANKSKTSVGGRGALTLNVGGEERILTLNTREAIRGQLHSLVTSGHTSSEDMSNYLVKARLRSLANQVKAHGIPIDGNYQRGITGGELNRIIQNIDELRDKDSYNGIIEYLSNLLYGINERHKELGLKQVTIENPMQVVPSRRDAIRDPLTGFGVRGDTIMSRSITEATAIMGRGTNKRRLNIIGDSAMKDVVETHDRGAMEILRKSRIIDDSGRYRTQRIAGPTPMSRKLSDLANAFTRNDMEVAFLYGGEKRGLIMAITNKADAERIFKLSPNEILESNKVASVGIPMINSESSMILPGQERLARMKVLKNSDGSYRIGTGFDEIVDSLQRTAQHAGRIMAEGDALGTEAWLTGIVRKKSQRLSMYHTRQNLEEEDFFRVKPETSKASRWARGGAIDLSDFAEDWFESFYKDEAGKRRLGELRKRAEEEYAPFVEGMDFTERMTFQRSIDDWVQKEFGLRTDVHSMKDTHVSQYLRSTRDIRELTPFSYLNPMARENIMKSVNYLPLDEQITRDRLRDALRRQNPNLTDEQLEIQVERRMTRRFVTDTATSVMEGETNYLNLRAAYLNDYQLSKMMEEAKVSNARLTTYEGMFLIADDVAEAYSVTREKRIRFGKDEFMNEELVKVFYDEVGAFDETQSIQLQERRKLSDFMTRTNGRYTVSDMIKDQYKVEPGTAAYLDWQENVYVKGWDAETRSLILEKQEFLAEEVKMPDGTVRKKNMDGFKFVTDAGDRITGIVIPRHIFEQLGIDADVILDPMNASRRQFGSEVYKSINLIIDEAFRQSAQMVDGQITVGDLKGKEVLGEIQNMLHRNLGIKEHIQVQDGKLVMSSAFGLNGESVNPVDFHNLLIQAGKWLDKDLTKGITYGNIGLAAADTYNWENSFGITDNEGLVRWGIKEHQVIQSRLDRLADQGVIDRDSAIGKWLDVEVRKMAKEQKKDAVTYTKGILSTLRTYKDQTIKANDIVIRTRDTVFDPLGDKEGRTTGRIVGDHFEISMHAFNDLPTSSSREYSLTPGDYAKTIVSIRDLTIDRMMENGEVKSWEKAFQQMLDDAGGTVLFELPDDSFSLNDGRSARYVRFIDTAMSTNTPAPVLLDLQKSQAQIWRYTKYYQKYGEGYRDKLQESLDQYHEKAAHILGSGREGSVLQSLMTTKMDASGRFRIQSLNPLEASKHGYEELTTYVSRDRMLEMITNQKTEAIDDRIIQSLGIDVAGLDNAATQSKVLAHIEKNGLYGFTGRYPTITEDTIQIMKIAIDPNMAPDSRVGLLTAGTSIRLKADYDGDFFSTVLAHYKSAYGALMHREAQSIWKTDKAVMDRFSDEFLHGTILEDGTRGQDGLIHDLQESGLSVGDIMSATPENKDLYDLKQKYFQKWRSYTTPLDARESLEARLGKSYIGQVSNLGYKARTLASATFDAIREAGVEIEGYTATDLRRKQAVIGELGRMLEQDLISSKKYDTEDIRATLIKDGLAGTDEEVLQRLDKRVAARDMMIQGLMNPTDDGINLIRQGNSELGVLQTGTINDVDGSGSYAKVSVDEMLDVYQDLHKLNSSRKGWLSDRYLKWGVSEGNNLQAMVESLYGIGGVMSRNELSDELASLDDEFRQVYEEGQQYHKATILRNLNGMTNGGYGADPFSNLAGSGEIADVLEMRNGTVADRTAGQFREIASKFMSGMGGSGAGGFGAIRAAGAMFAGLWGASALMRSGPTPEETIRGKDGVIEDARPPHGSAMGMLKNPTARITPQGENINISINAKDASRMGHEQVSALVQQELSAMMPMQLNMNTTVNDNTQNIDQQWLQGIVAQALGGRII